jgi:hypothetical protein
MECLERLDTQRVQPVVECLDTQQVQPAVEWPEQQPNNQPVQQPKQRGYNLTMTKTRYYKLAEMLQTKLQDSELVDDVLDGVKVLFQFNPESAVYSKEYGIERKRQMGLEMGKSGYELFNKQYRKKETTQGCEIKTEVKVTVLYE